MTTLLHDMMHQDVEVYVNDMIVKSRDRADQLASFERFFEMIKQFNETESQDEHFWSNFWEAIRIHGQREMIRAQLVSQLIRVQLVLLD